MMRRLGLPLVFLLTAATSAGGEFALENAAVVDLPVSGIGAMRLRVRSRLVRSEGEGLFVPALKICVDGKPLAAKPVNVGATVCDPTVQDRKASARSRFDAATGAWLVHEDSDFVPWNFPAELNARWHWYNIHVAKAEWQNEYYDLLFDLPAGARSVRLENVAAAKLVGEASVGPKPAYPVFFQRPAGEHVFRFTELRPGETGLKKLTATACRGERATLVLSVKSEVETAWTWEIDGLDGADVRPLGYTRWGEVRGDWITSNVMAFRFGADDHFDMPDRLTAEHGWTVGAGEAGSLWIMYDVPKDAPSGLLKASIRLTDRQGAKTEIPIEIDVPDFDLPETGRMYGTWATMFPWYADWPFTLRQAKDLRDHGINTVFLNGNCVGVGADGKPGVSQLEKAMKLFKEYGFNEKMFIFYMGDPVFYALNLQIQKDEVADFRAKELRQWEKEQAAEAKSDAQKEDEVEIEDLDEQMERETSNMLGGVASRTKQSELGKADYPMTNRFWRLKAKEFFLGVGKTIEKGGFTPYFMPMDEPENGYMGRFVDFARFLTEETPYRIAGNLQVPNYYRYRDLVAFNICNGLNPCAVPKDWMKENCRALYRQVRSFDNQGSRLFFGYRNDAGGLKGCWGFAYNFNNNPFWSIANPVLEKDGRCGTTTGWESVRMGIWDSRYAALLDSLAPGEGVKAVREGMGRGCSTVAEIEAIRESIIARIRELKRNRP